MFELVFVRDWRECVTCTPTALAAISGQTAEQIDGLLRQVAFDDNRRIDSFRKDYSMKDWCEVLRRLGGNARQVNDYRRAPFDDRLPIDKWMLNQFSADLQFVLCDDGRGNGHLFATTQGDVVDTYTRGQREKFKPEAVPLELRLYRVKRTFRIEDRRNSL
jgi:hypothetical protein